MFLYFSVAVFEIIRNLEIKKMVFKEKESYSFNFYDKNFETSNI